MSVLRIGFFHGQINLVNDFQVHWSNSTFFQFYLVFFPTPRGPAEFQASGSESILEYTTYSVLYLGGRYLDKPLEVFDILKIYQNKVESFNLPLSQSILRQNRTNNQKRFQR